MAIPMIPLGTEPPDHGNEPEDHLTTPAASPIAFPEAPAAGHAAGGARPTRRDPQWPAAGWALQPKRAGGLPKRVRARALGPTAGIMVASVLALVGLLTWLTYGTFAGQTSHAWAPYPQAQAYYQPIVKPDIPASATVAKLPPMMVSTPAATVTLKVDAPPLGGMYGSTGQVQDAYSPAYFAVPAGKTIHVTIYNYDTMRHTFTSPVLGLNVWLHTATGSTPGKTTFTFKAPSTGYFTWFCDVPCDSYSMSRGGFMKGEVHAVKP